MTTHTHTTLLCVCVCVLQLHSYLTKCYNIVERLYYVSILSVVNDVALREGYLTVKLAVKPERLSFLTYVCSSRKEKVHSEAMISSSKSTQQLSGKHKIYYCCILLRWFAFLQLIHFFLIYSNKYGLCGIRKHWLSFTAFFNQPTESGWICLNCVLSQGHVLCNWGKRESQTHRERGI